MYDPYLKGYQKYNWSNSKVELFKSKYTLPFNTSVPHWKALGYGKDG